MRSRAIPETKSRAKIPRIAVIVITIILAGLGAKGAKYILNHSEETQPPGVVEKATYVGGVEPSFGWVRPAASLSDYQAVVEHDLLKPLGWEKTVPMTPPPKPVVQREVRQERPAPTNDLVLTGIVRLGEEPMALVEDDADGKAYFLKEGDRLKDYLVEAIAEESIVLAKGDSKLMPELGSKANYDSNERSPASEVTGEKAASSDSAAANLSLIERMKARRRKELGQE